MARRVQEAAEADAVATSVPLEDLDDVAPAPTIASLVARIRGRALWDSFAPLVLFLVLNTTAGLVPAIVAATVWTLGVLLYRLSRGEPTSRWAWAVIAYIALRGVLAAFFHSTLVYFGPALLNQSLLAIGFAVSAIVGKPATKYVAQFIYPFNDVTKNHPMFNSVFTRLTWMWAAYLALSTSLHAYLLLESSTTLYLTSRLVTWPLMIALFAFSLRYPRGIFKRVPELAPYVERAEALRTTRRTEPAQVAGPDANAGCREASSPSG